MPSTDSTEPTTSPPRGPVYSTSRTSLIPARTTTITTSSSANATRHERYVVMKPPRRGPTAAATAAAAPTMAYAFFWASPVKFPWTSDCVAGRRGALRLRLEHAGSADTARAEFPEEAPGQIASALNRLSAVDREAITLVAWDGLRPSEAAAVLGESPAAFRVRLHRARRRLRRELDRGGTAGPHHRHSIAQEIA